MNFNVCILGSGGREYAIYLAVCKSPLVKNVFFVPGNAGVDASFDINPLDFDSVLSFVEQKKINVIIVGSEEPLVAGIKTYFHHKKPELLIIGPSAKQAMLEGSKVFSFNFMNENLIPQANGWVVSSFIESKDVLMKHFQNKKVVLKVDGLAGGKGVSIHTDLNDAIIKLEQIFQNKLFGDAGSSVLIQYFMEGTEASIFVLCNGTEAIYLPTAQDYKKLLDDDLGPNTGGMGSFAPSVNISDEQIAFIDQNVTKKVLDTMQYRGILYIGLMLHSQSVGDISVVEFNCRLGDPETQAILPLLEFDLFSYFLWTEQKNLKPVPKIKKNKFYQTPFKPMYSINVVIVAKGYPESYPKDIPICINGEDLLNTSLIHAATKRQKDGNIVSSGGRILNFVATAKELATARSLAYSYIKLWFKKQVNTNLFHIRNDIGQNKS